MFQGTALITGGTSGIGAALARRLLQNGANVAVCARAECSPGAIVPDAGSAIDSLLAIQADVTVPAQVAEAIRRTVNRFGRLDVLVNSAGVGALGPITELTDDRIADVLDTNVRGALQMCREAWPHMAAQKQGHIVNLCGILGIKAIAQAALYTASKHALAGMGSALALEGRRVGIRVTNVFCSAVDSPFWDDVPGKPRADMLLTPDEVAAAIADLLALPAHVTPNQLVLQHMAHQL